MSGTWLRRKPESLPLRNDPITVADAVHDQCRSPYEEQGITEMTARNEEQTRIFVANLVSVLHQEGVLSTDVLLKLLPYHEVCDAPPPSPEE